MQLHLFHYRPEPQSWFGVTRPLPFFGVCERLEKSAQSNLITSEPLEMTPRENPKTTPRGARLAREGKKVMQFLSAGRYVAVVVDGRVQFYGKAASSG